MDKLAQFSGEFIATNSQFSLISGNSSVYGGEKVRNQVNSQTRKTNPQGLQMCEDKQVHKAKPVVRGRRQVGLHGRRQRRQIRNRHARQQVINPGEKARRSCVSRAKNNLARSE